MPERPTFGTEQYFTGIVSAELQAYDQFLVACNHLDLAADRITEATLRGGFLVKSFEYKPVQVSGSKVGLEGVSAFVTARKLLRAPDHMLPTALAMGASRYFSQQEGHDIDVFPSLVARIQYRDGRQAIDETITRLPIFMRQSRDFEDARLQPHATTLVRRLLLTQFPIAEELAQGRFAMWLAALSRNLPVSQQ